MTGRYPTLNRVFLTSVLYLILGATNNFSFGADDFYFTKISGESSGKKTVLDGERRVILECAVSDRTQIGFQWTLNGVPIENTTRRHQIGSNLYFSRIERDSDSGVYGCVATNLTTAFTISSPTIALNIVYSSLKLLGEKSTDPKKSQGSKSPRRTRYFGNKNGSLRQSKKSREEFSVDKAEMARYRELAEQNKPVVVEPTISSTKGPKSNVKWNSVKNRITVRLSSSSHSQILIGKSDPPPKKPRTIKRASTAIGEYTTRILDENNPKDFIGRPYTAPAHVEFQEESFTEEEQSSYTDGPRHSNRYSGSVEVSGENSTEYGEKRESDSLSQRKSSGGSKVKSNKNSLEGRENPGKVNGNAIVNYMSRQPPTEGLQQVHSKLKYYPSLGISTRDMQNLDSSHEMKTIMRRNGSKKFNSQESFDNPKSDKEGLPLYTQNLNLRRSSPIKSKNRSRFTKTSNSKFKPRRIFSA